VEAGRIVHPELDERLTAHRRVAARIQQ
jgi:hypothetical protein